MELNRPSLYDIACHFCVSRIIGAAIPYTRLSNILESMFHGRPLSALSLSYLKQQKLNELHQLAIGQITYEAFIAALDPALVAREQAARIEHQAKEAELLAQQAERAVQRKREGEAAEAARIARTAQSNREREAAEAARIVREAEWAAQCKRNCEAAEAMYYARMSEPGYIAPTPYDIARHYRVSHLQGAVTSPLSNILGALYQGRPLSAAYPAGSHRTEDAQPHIVAGLQLDPILVQRVHRLAFQLVQAVLHYMDFGKGEHACKHRQLPARWGGMPLNALRKENRRRRCR